MIRDGRIILRGGIVGDLAILDCDDIVVEVYVEGGEVGEE